MSQPEQPERRTAGRALGAIALIVVGLVILVPSGLCTSVMGYNAIVDSMTNGAGGSASLLAVALVIGGPFVVAGTALIIFGVKRWRR